VTTRDAVLSALVEPIHIIGGGVTGSTMDDARELARAGAPEGTVVVASAQDGGRGRLGRAWDSPPGGVYCSIILRPKMCVADIVSLPLVVSLCIAEGLEVLGVRLRLKWPNDIFAAEGKVGGILMEMAAESDRVEWVVVGVGINVVRPEDDESGAFLADQAPGIKLADVAAVLIDCAMAAGDRLQRGGFRELRPAYIARLNMLGEPVVLKDPAGSVVAQGVLAGVDEAGRVLIDDGGHVQVVSSGDVSLRVKRP